METELSASIAELIDRLIQFNTFLLMLTMGLGLTFLKAFVLWQKPAQVVRAVAVAVVGVIVVAVAMSEGAAALDLDVPLEARLAVLLMAGAAGNALAPGLAAKIGANAAEAISLMVTLSLASIIAMPVIVATALPSLPDGVEVSGGDVLSVVARNMLAPLFVGLAVRTFWVTAADLVTDTLTKISGVMLNVVVVVIILRDFDSIIDLGWVAVVFILVTLGLWLALGHFLGGAEKESRLLLAANSSQRNGAIAMLVAIQGLDQAVPAIVATGVLALLVVVAYFSIVGKAMLGKSPSPETETELEPS